MLKCVDISAWQGKISKASFEKNSIPCYIIRTSYTMMKSFSMHEDKVLENNIVEAYKAGKNIGVYHYSQAISEAEAIKEAEFVIKILRRILKKYNIRIVLPVVFDWEFGYRLSSYVAGKMGKKRCGYICDAFCRTIRSAGFDPMVYANLSTLNAYIDSDIWKRWKIWVAQYNSKCNYKHPYYMWQYTSSGSVKGLPGRIDMNNLYGTVGGQTAVKTVSKYAGPFPKLPKRGWFSSGDKGEEVKKLQRFLNWYGGYGLDVDGEVGRKTINAVKEFQGREKITIDGAFGEESLARAKSVKA